MSFYCLNGVKIQNTDGFVSYYSKQYFLGGKTAVPRLNQSSGFVEKEIMKIHKRGISSTEDLHKVLAWKAGKIRHRESEQSQSFCFADGWTDQSNIVHFNRKIQLQPLADLICRPHSDLYQIACADPQAVLNQLRDCHVAGIGTVYSLTLLFFISRGVHPIYDRFARVALDAILRDKKPSIIKEEKVPVFYATPPAKDSAAFLSVYQDLERPYERDLEQLFGSSYQTDRNVDRALWVYGHLFRQTNTKC